jgi:ABC-type dipeptide/oligopeptide/nickel transport system permease component
MCSVTTELITRFPRTFLIAFLSIILSMIVGIPLGIHAAVHENTFQDRLSMFLSLLGVSMPGFWLALMLVILFALQLRWLPPSGIGGIQYYILPAVANSLNGIASMSRQTRSSMLEVIRADYVTTARAKGQVEGKILYEHALPNALIPIITVIGTRFGMLLGGTLVLETVFSIPGIGSYLLKSINARDYAAVEGSIIFVAFVFSAVMLLVDLIYAFVDPRIRAQYVRQRERKSNE